MRPSTDDSRAAVAAVERAYRAFRDTAGEDGWLAPLQDRALAAFARRGFPTVRDEDWKYTNVARLAASGGELLRRAPQPPDLSRIEARLSQLPKQPGDATIVFANGRYAPALSNPPAAGSGIRITTMADADARERFLDWFDDDSMVDQHAFVALNSAFMIDGVILDIGEDANIEQPIHVVFASDDQPVGIQARLLVSAGKRSSARIFEHHVSSGPGWTNAMSEFRCATAARLTYVKLQDEDVTTDHIASQCIRLGPDSEIRAAHVDLGAGLARNDLRVLIGGTGARADLFGLFLADGQRHVDNHTRIDHAVGHSVSEEQYRGIVGDRARGVFNGKIIVREGADGTDARLNNRNLLLSRTAEIDTKPELEIYTDDVKCSHGATTGQLDEQALFYLRSRGIPHARARHMLVLAFAREIFAQFDPSDVRLLDYIDQTLERRLPE